MALKKALEASMRSKNESNIVNNSNQKDLSLAEIVFDTLQIYPGGFKPTFFSTKVLLSLSLTSKTIGNVASGELRRRKSAAQPLLNHVVRGEQEQAEAIIKENPELLLFCSQAVDYSGRTITGTAFQAAIGSGDKPMWTMMLPYFEDLEQGEALRQFNEQFPNGIEDEISAGDLKNQYNNLALAIIKSEDGGQAKIEQFRTDITSQKEVTKGKHFNLQHLIAAYQAYIDNYDALANRANREKFWQKIIGYVQRQMTAYDAQVHCSGVKSVLEKKYAFKRSLEFTNSGKFFPLAINSGLGYDLGCCSRSGWGEVLASGMSLSLWCLENYLEQKQAHLQDLESHLSEACIISPLNYS